MVYLILIHILLFEQVTLEVNADLFLFELGVKVLLSCVELAGSQREGLVVGRGVESMIGDLRW